MIILLVVTVRIIRHPGIPHFATAGRGAGAGTAELCDISGVVSSPMPGR